MITEQAQQEASPKLKVGGFAKTIPWYERISLTAPIYGKVIEFFDDRESIVRLETAGKIKQLYASWLEPVKDEDAVYLLDANGQVSTLYIWFVEAVYTDESVDLRREDGKLKLTRFLTKNTQPVSSLGEKS